MKGLTKKQAKVLSFIKDFIEKVGWPPSLGQIASHFGVSSKSAYEYVQALVKKGYIIKVPKIARGIKLVEKEKNNGR